MQFIARLIAIISLLSGNVYVRGMLSGGGRCLEELEKLERCLKPLLTESSGIEKQLKELKQHITDIKSPSSEASEQIKRESIPFIEKEIRDTITRLQGGQNSKGLNTQKAELENSLRAIASRYQEGSVQNKLAQLDQYKKDLEGYSASARVGVGEPTVRELRQEIATLEGLINDAVARAEEELKPKSAKQEPSQGWKAWLLEKVGFGSSPAAPASEEEY